MTTKTTTVLKGGEWLIKETEVEESFFPEDLSDEQKMIRDMCNQYLKSEVIPLLEKRFEKENTEIKTEIIKACAMLQEQNEAGLLPKWLIKTQEAEIQKQCLDALVLLDAIGSLNNLDIKEPTLKGLVHDLIKQQHS